jgi:CheY-like chemotaxis protein
MENNYGRTILVVDDLASVRKWIRTCLQQAGYPVIEAASGSEELSLFQQYETGIALVVSAGDERSGPRRAASATAARAA